MNNKYPNKNLSIGTLIAVVAGLLSTGAAHADLIDVNFTNGSHTMSGAAAIGASGNQWNNLTSAVNDTTTDLIDVGGTDTHASLKTLGFNEGSTGDYNSDGSNAFKLNLFADGIASWGALTSTDTSATLTFAGLPTGTYELELYTSNDDQTAGQDPDDHVGLDRQVTFTTNLGGATATTLTSDNAFVPGDNYVSITGKTDPSTGNLVITITTPAGNDSGGTEGFVDIMGVQLQSLPIPEPSTWAMMFAGLVSLIGLRRFTRKV